MEHFFAGAISGLLSDALVHPLDTIRARMQVSSRANNTVLSNILKSAVNSKYGFRDLYRGFGVVAIGTVPGHALYFAGYEHSKVFFKDLFGYGKEENGNKSQSGERASLFLMHLTCGFVADICGALVWTPMEVVKQRLQVNVNSPTLHKTSSASWKSIVSDIMKKDGILGFYRGFGLALMTYGPYVSIYFALYEEWKSKFCSRNNDDGSNRISFLICSFSGAALSSSISAALTCPLDVVKTRVQVYEGSHTPNMYTRTAKELWTQEGTKGFFRGLKPRVLWMAGGTALTMVFYEGIKMHL